MTGRELMLDAFHARPVDHIPCAPFIHVNFVGAFFGSRDADPISGTIEVYEHFGLDIIHRNCTPAHNELGAGAGGWEVESAVEVSADSETATTVIHTPGGDLTQVHRLNWVSEYDAEASPLEYLIKSERDFDLIREYQPPIEEIDTTPIVRAKAELGDRGIIAPWMQGAFSHVTYYYRAVEEMILDAMTNPGFYREMMEYFLERNMRVAEQHIEAGVDVMSYGGNIASGKMVGGPFFGKYVLEYENRLIDFIQARGVPVLYHNCGCARSLFAHYKALRTKAYESLTPPPYGDTILQEAFAEFPPETILCGGVDQIEFLRTASRDEIRENVRGILDLAKPRGNFILGTTDYFDEDTPSESIRAFAAAGADYGRY